MTNREKFAEQILDIACSGDAIAVNKVTSEPIACHGTACEDCLFYVLGKGYDRNEMKKWANSEYVEPPVDWTKVPVDTPILVRGHENREWTRRHFAKIKNGTVFAWHGGATSWSKDDEEAVSWKYAKLAESEE